ncbi:phosphate--nucleotide phosphotransferase [Capnocytophaga stomatis]|uniref:Phosphate--nucleotide phosphotransferase n=1 Tax=Capnocytophaga stomatis TaxID=1848904 RepID=A0A250FWK0_9FLAO|nr:PPK2 family polyphosphate kinase [Capnocytophaga stomatis]ATA88337.1 phosphate--nucleotide phosphotransferase [Capnocytophaga stomatis]
MSKINPKKYRVKEDINLSELNTYEDFLMNEESLKAELKEVSKKLADFQDVLYAHNRYSVLVCIQGMDTSGKDSLIRDVFKGFNTQGIEVHSFKSPSQKELEHDYLWRHYIALPERGKFGIFNRTHYENVTVTRVHPEYILNENLPKITKIEDIDEKFWKKRFKQIRKFEKNISENGTIIFKFFLNISKEEQRRRLLERLNNPSKNWKFSIGDLNERKLWDKYQKYYEEAINETYSKSAPWYIIPANNKKAARLLVAKILWNTLKKYEDIKYPEISNEINLAEYKEQLSND